MNIEKILNEALMKEPEFESFPLSLSWQDGFRKGFSECEALLKKYLEHIGGINGVTFLSDSDFDPDDFTQEEWNLLQKIDRESSDE